MTQRLLDPGQNPTAPCSVSLIGSEEAQNIVIVDGSSTTPVGTASNPMRVDPTGSTTQPISGTVTVNQPVAVTDNSGSLTIDNSTLAVVGGGTEATALRVTVANDSTGVLSVDDNGGSLTVDGTVAVSSVGGTVAATQSGTWNINNVSGTVSLPTGAATETTLSAINTKTPSLGQAVMASSVPVAIASNQTAIPVTDNSGSLTVDGTVAATQSGTWNVGTVTTVTTVGTVTNITNQGQLVDNAGFTDGTTRLNMAGFIFDEVAGTALTENDGAAARIDSKRAAICTIEDETTRGRRATVTAANALKVDGSAVTQPISGSLSISSITPGTAASNLGKAEDAAHASGDVGVMALGVRNDSLGTTISGTDGDYTPIATTATGQVYVALRTSDSVSPVRAEDDAFGAFQGVMVGGSQRQNTPAEETGTDGDIQPLKSDNVGRLYTNDNRTGASAQQIQGTETISGTLTGKGVAICGKELFTGTQQQPTLILSGGVNYTACLIPDLALNFLSYSTSGEMRVAGLTAHDAVDASNPLKIGGKANSYKPATSDQPSANKTAVASLDRTDAAYNVYGEFIEGVNPYFFTLNNISTTYNNTTTTATSTAKECWNYRQATFSYELTRANSPTDILFEIEISLNNGSTFTVQQNDFLGDLRESTASITASGIKKSVTFPIGCFSIRVKATATGTTASATFTAANCCLYLRN